MQLAATVGKRYKLIVRYLVTNRVTFGGRTGDTEGVRRRGEMDGDKEQLKI